MASELMSLDRRYYSLQDFFLVCFHEDWRLDDPSTSAVIDRFRRETSSDVVNAVVSDVDSLLMEDLSDDDLRSHVLDRYSLSYDPQADGLTMRDWLRQTRDALSRTKDSESEARDIQ